MIPSISHLIGYQDLQRKIHGRASRSNSTIHKVTESFYERQVDQFRSVEIESEIHLFQEKVLRLMGSCTINVEDEHLMCLRKAFRCNQDEDPRCLAS